MSKGSNAPECYGCEHLMDAFGNYSECGLSAKEGTHMFVDYFYWNGGSPNGCPIKGGKVMKRDGINGGNAAGESEEE